MPQAKTLKPSALLTLPLQLLLIASPVLSLVSLFFSSPPPPPRLLHLLASLTVNCALFSFQGSLTLNLKLSC